MVICNIYAFIIFSVPFGLRHVCIDIYRMYIIYRLEVLNKLVFWTSERPLVVYKPTTLLILFERWANER